MQVPKFLTDHTDFQKWLESQPADKKFRINALTCFSAQYLTEKLGRTVTCGVCWANVRNAAGMCVDEFRHPTWMFEFLKRVGSIGEYRTPAFALEKLAETTNQDRHTA